MLLKLQTNRHGIQGEGYSGWTLFVEEVNLGEETTIEAGSDEVHDY